MTAILAMWGFLGNFRDDFLTPDQQAKWVMRLLFPRWYWVVIGFLGITIVAILEGAYRTHATRIEELNTSHQSQVRERENAHKDELEQKDKAHRSQQSTLIEGHVKVETGLLDLHKTEVEGLKKNFKSVVESNTEQARKQRETYETHTSKLTTEIGSLKSQLEEKPNLVYVCHQINFIHIDAQDVLQEGGDGDRTITAVVAKFQNKADPPRKASPAKSVIAHITYYEVDGQPYEYAIEKGTWVAEEYNHIDFEVGDAERLVIATQMKMGMVLNYQNNNDSPHRHRGLSVCPLDREQFIVHVELVVRGNTEVGTTFKFRLTLKPSFLLELLDSQESVRP